MNIERGAISLAVGLGTSWLNGAYDSKRLAEGPEGFADVMFCTTFWTGACVMAGLYLEMPAYVPVALAVFIRAGTEFGRFYDKVASILNKE